MNARQTGVAVEYLRRSVERDKGADRDQGAGQRSANRAQAAADGVEIVRTFDGDWGTSGGRGKRESRTAMAELIGAIRAGEVSRVYCHTTDRLARDVEYGMTFWNACKDAGTLIRAGSQTFDPREPGYLTLWTVLLSQAEEDLDRMSRKNGDTFAWRREHIETCGLPGRPHEGRCHLIGCTDRTHCRYSHRIGHPNYGGRPGESLPTVIEAFRDAGSAAGAARLLNAPTGATVRTKRGRVMGTGRNTPTRMGGPWTTNTVREILIREGVIPHRSRPGAKPRAPFMFYGLLRCHCGHILTGTRYQNGPQPQYTAYRCHVSKTVDGHGRGVVTEKSVLAWARDEAARLQLPGEAVELRQRDEQRASEFRAKRKRVLDNYEDGLIDRSERNAKLSTIDADLGSLVASQVIVDIPEAIDWDTWSPEAINDVLRALWSHVELDADLRPVRAEWRLPAEYVA